MMRTRKVMPVVLHDADVVAKLKPESASREQAIHFGVLHDADVVAKLKPTLRALTDVASGVLHDADVVAKLKLTPLRSTP